MQPILQLIEGAFFLGWACFFWKLLIQKIKVSDLIHFLEVEEILNTLNEKQLSTAIDDLAEAFNSYLF